MKLQPRRLDGELEGDFFCRKARFFFHLSLPCGAIGLVLVLAFTSFGKHEHWQIFYLAVPGTMLLSASFLALVGAWFWSVRRLSCARSKANLIVDRVLYFSAVIAVMSLAAAAFYYALDGYVSGEVRFRRGKTVESTHSPILYWLVELMWIGCGIALLYGALKHWHMMVRDGHLRANRVLQRRLKAAAAEHHVRHPPL